MSKSTSLKILIAFIVYNIALNCVLSAPQVPLKGQGQEEQVQPGGQKVELDERINWAGVISGTISMFSGAKEVYKAFQE